MMERSLEDVEELKARMQFWVGEFQSQRFAITLKERMEKLQEIKKIIENIEWNPYDKKILMNFWEKHMAMLVSQRLES